MSDTESLFRDPDPDEEREVDLDEEAEFELPPATVDPDERIEAEVDPLEDDMLDEARGTGELDR